MRFIKKNPELQKNIWLELNTQRLVLMPVIILILLFLSFLRAEDTRDAGILRSVCYSGVTIILTLWGSKVAHDNIISEYNERTWDWQRTSALTPWQLLVGKLFGAPIYNWYGGAICLGLWIMFSLFTPSDNVLVDILYNGLCAIVISIGMMCVVMIFALYQIKSGNGRDKLKGGFVFAFLIIAGLSIFGLSFSGLFNIHVVKYNIFHLFQYIFYSAWAVFGLYCALRGELSYKTSALPWYIFLLSSSVVQAFARFNAHAEVSFFWIFSFSLAFHAIVFLYILIIIEQKEITKLRNLFQQVKKRNLKYLNFQAPLWIHTLPLVFIGLLLSWIGYENTSWPYPIWNLGLREGSFSDPVQTWSFILAAALFIIRDMALILLLNFSRKKRRVNGAVILYLFLLYAVAPLLSFSVSEMRCVFLPTFSPFGFIPSALEAAILVLLLVKKVKAQPELL